MSILRILLLIALVPVVIYLQEQAYRNVHGNATIGRDFGSLIRKVRDWHERRERRRKYRYLNKPKDKNSNENK